MRETAKMLASKPEAVAVIAMTTVNQMPYPPMAGRAASASEPSLVAMRLAVVR